MQLLSLTYSWQKKIYICYGRLSMKNLRDAGNYRIVDGRTYHTVESVAYPLPHDEGETKRLLERHRIFRKHLGAMYFAPVTEVLSAGGAHVLDSGCGPGAWTLEMAETFPKSHFHGIDLSPHFMQTIMTNVTFTQRNMLDGLSYPDATFDFAYSRALFSTISEEQWRNVYVPELIRVLKPGGWVEFHEVKLDPNAGGPSWKRLVNMVDAFFVQSGIDVNFADNIPRLFESTGQLTDIKVEESKLLIGPKGGELGERYFPLVIQFWEAAMPAFAAAGKVTFEDYRALVQSYAIEATQVASYVRTIEVYARKKLATE